MNKPTFNRILLILIVLLTSLQLSAQNYVPFTPRFDQDLKGDILLIGNNILGPNNNPYNNDNVYNHNVDMQYIDIDGDNTTFSSSSADLEIPNPNCYVIRYAGLYWGAVTDGDEPITQVKFKGPTGAYNDITGTLVFEANGSSVDGGDSFPYACYADVTDIVTGYGGDDLGTYTVANVSSARGETATFNPYNGTGYSSGWSLFVVYEDPTLPGKSITSFDGFSAISVAGNNANVEIPVSGFRTVPAPAPVRANFAFATLEGDKPILGDRLKLNGTSLSTLDRQASNFFNSSVTQLNALPVNNRNPNSTNTLGFDTGVMRVPNPGNTVIANDATSAVVRLETSGDTYFPYFFALAVDIIEPDIVLTKIVEDEFGNDIGGQVVGLGQDLNYIIGFQNVGNDNATNLTIRDILPINIIFDYPIDLVLPTGVTVSSYNPVTRELIFDIEDYLVEENDPVYEIRIEAQVVDSCQQLADACSNIINNQAFATYQGTLNPTFIITDDPSYSTNTGCLISPQATNFLADLDDCIFIQNEVLCGDSLQLTAADGYDTYSWSTSPSGTPVIGTTQTITVNTTGTYYSFNTAIAPCQSIVQEYHVELYGGSFTNPVIPFADEVVICPDDGKELPNIFLCGENDFREIETDIEGAVTIIWEKLDESSCAPIGNTDCANENDACTWNQVGTGPDFIANVSGQYRLTINYQGGCFNQFYFNVYQNILDPTIIVNDIICTSPGSITVNNVPSGYEYSLDGSNWQEGNVFLIITPGIYTVYIQQEGVPNNACLFTIPDVLVRERDFTVSTIIEQPQCNGDKGSIYLAANDVEPQYFFALYQGGMLVNSVGPILENNFVFENLNPGTYNVTVETEDGCTYTEEVIIIEPPLLTVNAALTIPLTCNNGEITIYPQGGTAPYFYFINSTTVFQTIPEYVVTVPGVYDITVVDANNCSAATTIIIEASLAPEFTISKTDILCNGDTSGSITINVTNPNGNSLEYSINGGFNYSNSPVFTGLAAGNYGVVVQFTNGPSVCVTDPQLITINTNDPIDGEAELEAPYTCDSTGTITVINVTGGTAPYMYSIDGMNFQADPTFTGLTPGTYTVIIKDANNCTFFTNEITIPILDPPTDLQFSNSPLTCPDNTTTVTITGTTGGVAPLEYQIIAPAGAATPYQNSNIFNGLTPGTYIFQVKDANNCVYSESFAITPLPAISIISETLQNVSCVGEADGSIQFIVSGTSTFDYTINGGAITAGSTPIVLTSLPAGVYTIVVTDTATNCEATAIATIEEPISPLMLDFETSPITCIENGNVVINVTGGWENYSYTLTLPDNTILPTQNTNIFTNLAQSGIYTISVQDANGCIVTDTFELTIPTPPVATISLSSDICYDTDNGAAIEITVTSGEAPFEYSINGGPFQSNNVFANLVPGTYTITIRDDFGCETTMPAQIIAPQLIVNAVLTKDLDCTASPDAVITGTIEGGTAPYSYAVSINGAVFSPLGTTGTPYNYIANTDATYQFEITDANGCMATSQVITVNPITFPAIVAIIESQPILCNGDENGAIDITIDVTTGTPPFTINVNNNTTGTDYGTQTTGLTAGTYSITITDANSCSATEMIIIDQPEPIIVNFDAIDITCGAGGVSQGSIIITSVSGGIPPYNYFVTGSNGYAASELNANGSTSVTFDVVDFGLYEINVVDSNGCSVLEQDVLVASPPDDLDIDINASVDCATGGEAVVTVSSSLGSTGPFHFAIYQGPGTIYPMPTGAWLPENPPLSQSTIFSGLTPGVTYTFIVYDESTMCSYYETATTPVPTNSTLTATALSSDNVTCTGSDDGDVSFTVNSTYGASVDVAYEIFDSLSQISTSIAGLGTVPSGGSLIVTDLGPLPFGTYYVLIEETTGINAGCGVVTAPFSISESAILLSLMATIDQNANCNPLSGVVSAIAQNGTAPYEYQITTTPVAPMATDPAWASTSTFNVNAGSYYVHALDAFGCIVSTPVQVVPMDASPVISGTVNNQCDVSEGNFEIIINLTTAGSAPYSISLDGGSFQVQNLPFTIEDLSSGIHTIAVNDVNGCGNSISVEIVPPIGVNPEVTALPSCLNNDGEITIAASGGTGNYTYAITPAQPSIVLTGNVFSGVPSGNYTVTVTDTITMCSVDVQVILANATPVVFTTETLNVSCNGESDGIITVILPSSNDNPIYTYEITAPITVPAQTENIFTGLPIGTYTVQVTSGRDCVAIEDVTIIEPPLLEVTAVATTFSCDANNTVSSAFITISESGGTAGYTYSINGVNYFNTNIFEVIDTGVTQNITVYVTDTNGCTATNAVVIDPLPTITAAAFTIAAPIDCNETGAVTITVTGGSGNFTYQMLPNGVVQASNTFDITEPGTYYFQINDLETDCYFLTASFTVNPFDEIEAQLEAIQANDCFGDTNGELQLTITGYSGAYNYQLEDGTGTPIGALVMANTSTNPQIITGLASGNYSVTVIETESPFCTTSTNTVNIGTPPASLTLAISETSNVTCDNNQGTITAIADGGTSPYEYELTGDATMPYSLINVFPDLSAGTYTINVIDANGCIATDTITLIEPTPINADFVADTNLLSCFGDQNGILTVTNVTGGQVGNYTYTLNTITPVSATSGPQASNIFENIGAGTYSVTITDGWDCMFTSLPITINQPDPISPSLVAATTPTCQTDATLTLSATGGTGGYEYSLNDTFNPILGTFINSITFTVTAGAYEYYVRDENGCVAIVSNEITIDELPELNIDLFSENPEINCTGDNTGTIVATATGGLGDYVYFLQDPSGNTIVATQDYPGIFTGLTAGTYVVYVESVDCVAISAEIMITEPDTALSITYEVNDVTCSGDNNGSIEIFTEGGSGIIQFAISPQLNQFFETNIFENLAPGVYDVIVQDELGCYQTINFEINEPLAVLITIIPDSLIPEICTGDANGSFIIAIEGGTLPYSVSIDSEAYIVGDLNQTEFDFENLAGGIHTIHIIDSAGCESDWNIPFPDAIFIDPMVIIEYMCINNTTENIVTVTVDESIIDTTQLEYSLNDGPFQSSNIFENLPPSSDNFVTVQHTNGCMQMTDFFDIESFTPLSLELSEGDLNEIIATAAGGTGGYQFTLNEEDYGSTNTFIIGESGVYTVTVIDSSGCQISATIEIEFIEICIPNYFTPNGDGTLDYWYPGCAQNYPKLHFSIFDRYGRKVAYLHAGQHWDGRYNGAELPTGDYWYVVQLGTENDREFVGHFTLYR